VRRSGCRWSQQAVRGELCRGCKGSVSADGAKSYYYKEFDNLVGRIDKSVITIQEFFGWADRPLCEVGISYHGLCEVVISGYADRGISSKAMKYFHPSFYIRCKLRAYLQVHHIGIQLFQDAGSRGHHVQHYFKQNFLL
jgi:hypothetical protein